MDPFEQAGLAARIRALKDGDGGAGAQIQIVQIAQPARAQPQQLHGTTPFVAFTRRPGGPSVSFADHRRMGMTICLESWSPVPWIRQELLASTSDSRT